MRAGGTDGCAHVRAPGTMHADMETDFIIGEQHMYDGPDYPAASPNLKEPVREEREAGPVSAP